jgi:hypothetical protein
MRGGAVTSCARVARIASASLGIAGVHLLWHFPSSNCRTSKGLAVPLTLPLAMITKFPFGIRSGEGVLKHGDPACFLSMLTHQICHIFFPSDNFWCF